jgi:hypothetical protein
MSSPWIPFGPSLTQLTMLLDKITRMSPAELADFRASERIKAGAIR